MTFCIIFKGKKTFYYAFFLLALQKPKKMCKKLKIERLKAFKWDLNENWGQNIWHEMWDSVEPFTTFNEPFRHATL